MQQLQIFCEISKVPKLSKILTLFLEIFLGIYYKLKKWVTYEKLTFNVGYYWQIKNSQWAGDK